jgi:hypothetical protein
VVGGVTNDLTLPQVEAEKLPEVAERYDVKAVPYFVFLVPSLCFFRTTC